MSASQLLCVYKRATKFRLALFALLLLATQRAATGLLAYQQSESSYASLRANGWLGFGIDPGQYPFSFFAADGSWQGIDADLAQAVCHELALKCAHELVGYDAMYDALNARRVEAGISAWSFDAARTEDAGFSQPYFDSGLLAVFVVGKAPRPVARDFPAALSGQSVAVVFGSDGDGYLRGQTVRNIAMARLQVANGAAAIAALERGEADIALIDAIDVPRVAPNLQMVNLRPVPLVILTHPADARLRREIDSALTKIVRRGELDAILDKWLVRR